MSETFLNLPNSWRYREGFRILLVSEPDYPIAVDSVHVVGNEVRCDVDTVFVSVDVGTNRVSVEDGSSTFSWETRDVIQITNKHGGLLWMRGARVLDYSYCQIQTGRREHVVHHV